VPPNVESVTRQVIDAAFEVHRFLGPGFLESVYENALAIELTARQVPFLRQSLLSVTYKGAQVGRARVDFIVAESVVVELKAVENFAPIYTAQGISYLKASGLRLALLINFNVQRLENGLKRVILG
jgi:GxxExxY protein